jgi:hypothetical protein
MVIFGIYFQNIKMATKSGNIDKQKSGIKTRWKIREKSPRGGLHPFYKKTLPPVARCHPLRKTLGLSVVLCVAVRKTTRHVLSVTASLLQVHRGATSPK